MTILRRSLPFLLLAAGVFSLPGCGESSTPLPPGVKPGVPTEKQASKEQQKKG
jgi:hypothetical protein